MSRAREPQDRQDDRAAREEARTCFEAPIILEAGAGTGKTTTLVARILTWALGAGWERERLELEALFEKDPRRSFDAEDVATRVLDRVAAITFTEKAAAEMSERFAEALGRILGGDEVLGFPQEEVLPDVTERRARAGALLTNVHHLRVVTIHAFCAQLLARHPLEANLHPSFQVDAEGTALRTIVEEVIADRLTAGYGDPGDADLLELAALGVGPERLARVLEGLAQSPRSTRVFDDDPLSRTRVLATRDRLQQELASMVALLEGAFKEPGTRNSAKGLAVTRALRELHDALRRTDSAEALVEAARSVSSDEDVRKRLMEWGNERLKKTEKELLEPDGEEVVRRAGPLVRQITHLGKVNAGLLAHATRVLPPLLGEIHGRMRQRGVQTFAGLLADAELLLADHAHVAEAERASLRQLLVDEFQDTDPIQYDIVRHLALRGGESERPGLFLVGDPKQSIYGWRQADLRAYEEFVDEVCRAGGRRRQLCVNFRSVPAVLAEVERIVEPIMTAEEGIQPRFQRLLPSPENADRKGCETGDRQPVEYWVSWARTRNEPRMKLLSATSSGNARRLEARAVAADILDLHEHSTKEWKSFGLLMRNTTEQEHYLEALREAGIPYVVERDQSWYRRREVIDAAALVRTIVDPNDHLALVTFLRSPVVGVPDAALLPLWSAQLPQLVTGLGSLGGEPGGAGSRARMVGIDACIDQAVAAIPAGLPGMDRIEGWELSLEHGLRSLAALRHSFRTDSADRFVERLRALLLPEETEGARFLGAHRLANLERFFRRLMTALTEGGGGPQAVLRELRRGTGEGLAEEEGSPGDDTLDAVRVMSIHKAKGLTFDQVYLVDLHHKRKPDWSRDDGFSHGQSGDALEYRLLGTATLDYDLVQAEEQRVAAAESVRTLYVAATRPRQRLVLAGHWPPKSYGPDQEPPRLEQAQHGINLLQARRGGVPDFDAILKDADEGQPVRHEDPDGRLWRMPDRGGDDGQPVGPHLRRHERPEPVTVGVARTHLELLNGDRVKARTRMARSATATASTAGHCVGPLSLDEDEAAVIDPADEMQALLPETVGAAFAESNPHAREIGTVVHAVLERLDLDWDIGEELRRHRERLEDDLIPLLPARHVPDAVAAAEALLDHVARGRLLARLESLAPHILARELPFIMDADASGVFDEETRPLGAIIGTIDLLYRDPDTGSLVVADYKTDRADGTDALEERAHHHAPQGRIYTEAVAKAFPQEPAPRFELWFLHADKIVTL